MKQVSSLIFCLFITVAIFAQPTYTKYFGVKGSDNDFECSTMVPLDNGSVVALGLSLFGQKNYRWDIDFVKLDPLGNVLVQKRLSTDYSSGDVKGIQTSDGGFLLFTTQKELKVITGKQTMWGAALIKLNSEGKVEWSKYYNSVKFRHMSTNAIIETRSGDYIILFSLAHDYLADNKMGVMKISPVGDIIWGTTLAPDITFYYEYYGTSLLETSNGKILCGGYLLTEDPFQDYRNAVIELNADGKLEKSLYIESQYETPFQIKKIYQINKKIILYGGYTFKLNMDSPEFITGTLMNFQYFLYRKYPSLKPQQLDGTCYFKDGSIIKVFRDAIHPDAVGYDIIVKKYDSLFRICPDYTAQEVNENISAVKFQLRKLKVNNINDNYTVSDIQVYDSTLNFVQTFCTGDVPNVLKPTLALPDNNSKISIYPNPSDNILHVLNLKADEKYQLTIMNNLGNVFKQNAVENSSTYDFNLSGLKAGVYYLKVQSGKKSSSYMFIKK